MSTCSARHSPQPPSPGRTETDNAEPEWRKVKTRRRCFAYRLLAAGDDVCPAVAHSTPSGRQSRRRSSVPTAAVAAQPTRKSHMGGLLGDLDSTCEVTHTLPHTQHTPTPQLTSGFHLRGQVLTTHSESQSPGGLARLKKRLRRFLSRFRLGLRLKRG